MFFFFSSRRRHTRLQGDWSSDVCSSDLRVRARSPLPPGDRARGRYVRFHPCQQTASPGALEGWPGSSLLSPSQRADRKSTRLNSSHLVISYAVFCLKKKKKNKEHSISRA